MCKIKSLTWNDRIAIIEHFAPTDEVACNVLGVTHKELESARLLRTTGTLMPSKTVDFNAYTPLFSNTTTSNPAHRTSASSSIKVAQRPETATKKIPTPKKRGRKGDKIAKAFEAIPRTPMKVVDFTHQYGISVAVLRQSKRFDKTPNMGEVRVNKDKITGELMLWREPPTSV